MSIKIKGLKELTAKLKKFGADGEKSVKRNLEFGATNIERQAINNAPAQIVGVQLNIKQRIDKEVSNGGLTWKVGVQGQQDLDAYIEFGTGQNFIDIVNADPEKYTQEIIALAFQFYKNGQGTLIGTPYLFPAFFEESPELIKRLQRDLQTLANKV
jgi:HK97 gp10 family phage protein